MPRQSKSEHVKKQQQRKSIRTKKVAYDQDLTKTAFLHLINKEESAFLELLQTKKVNIDEIFLLPQETGQNISITIREYILLFYKNTDTVFSVMRTYALTMPIPYKLTALFGKGKGKKKVIDDDGTEEYYDNSPDDL